MSSIWKKMKDILSASDYFNSSNMLRFQKEDDYKTITGGVISIAIIIVIIVAFTKEILITLDKTSIQVTSNILKSDFPTISHLTFSPQTNGMFALLITGSSPNSNIRYFDVAANVFNYQSGQNGPIQSFMAVNMVACTSSHFQGFQNVGSIYPLDGLYCPQLGTHFDIFGKFASGKQSNFNLYVMPCNPSIPGAPCATQQQMSDYWLQFAGSIPISVFYLNTILTPDNPLYKRAYFEDREYAYIGQSFGSDIIIEMAEYTINTDQSIWPFTDQTVDSGLFIPSGMNVRSFPKTQEFPYYIFMRILKSTDTYTFQRTVQKLSTIFSYIGGVISSLVTAFFIMNKYTSFAFQISMANELFKKRDKPSKNNGKSEQAKINVLEKKIEQQKIQIPMSILLYFRYIAYNLIKKCFHNALQSQHLEYLKQCKQQMTKQLDIKRIIMRINCLQHCISNIVENQQLDTILCDKPVALQQIRKCRLKFEKQEQQVLIQESEHRENDIINLKKQGRIQDHKFTQHVFRQQLSASGLLQSKDPVSSSKLQNNLQNNLGFLFNKQKIRRRIQGSSRDSFRVEKNSGFSKDKKYIITSFNSQEQAIQEKYDDICEIPVEFLSP